MLKWTASAQKLPQLTPIDTGRVVTMRTPRLSEAKRRQRRATIANKENIPFTSTPMVPRVRNSPLVLAPLMDILNVTPEATPSSVAARTPEPRRNIAARSERVSIANLPSRRHSTVGFTIPTTVGVPQYASTLPRFEEEYSPNTVLPTGQQLAMRGLLPDPFLGNLRYFTTPEVSTRQRHPTENHIETEVKKIPPQKRKLEQEFAEIAQECGQATTRKAQNPAINTTAVNSAKMGDQTLDTLIDAILDSARKDEKKKKPRKSFNLRRRTLMKNQIAEVDEVMLSPSYAAGDDPASDLSFLLFDPTTTTGNFKKPFKAVTPTPASPLPQTPEPATPLPGIPIPDSVLQQLPTPVPLSSLRPSSSCTKDSNTTFTMETPVRSFPQKRRQRRLPEGDSSTEANTSKRFKVDARNYFEIGLALPSIYV